MFWQIGQRSDRLQPRIHKVSMEDLKRILGVMFDASFMILHMILVMNVPIRLIFWCQTTQYAWFWDITFVLYLSDDDLAEE